MQNVQPPASHFIDGAPVEDPAGEEIACLYPATTEPVARLHAATPDTVDRAVAAAAAAQKEWAARPPVERGRVLLEAARILRGRNQELSELETIDTGKPIQETLVADATSAADALEYFGGMIAAQTGAHIPLGPTDFAYTRHEPLGVCAGIGAWNYPTQIACWKGAPALAAGNAMVFKPSETTPLCALKIAEIFVEAGAPAGLYNVVQGYGETGAALVGHPDVAKVSLTGSNPTGRKVAAAAAGDLKLVTMELGGKSPLIVFDDADLDDAVGGAMLGNFYSSGQVCSNGTRVFVQRGVLEPFLDRLLARTRNIVIGDPLNPETQFGPMVSQRQLEIAERYVEIGRSEGAELLIGGERVSPTDAPNGWFLSPAVFAGVTDEMTIAQEEIFGPVLSVLVFDDEDEVVRRANDTQFGLSAGVFTRDLTRAHRVIAALEAGTCWINAYNLAPVQVPFGGVKGSGFGRENAAAALAHYTRVKSVYVGMGPVESPY
ncbi:MAG: betaine-aldehyde dehydrogenase [Pseudomonadota bacterium]